MIWFLSKSRRLNPIKAWPKCSLLNKEDREGERVRQKEQKKADCHNSCFFFSTIRTIQ